MEATVSSDPAEKQNSDDKADDSSERERSTIDFPYHFLGHSNFHDGPPSSSATGTISNIHGDHTPTNTNAVRTPVAQLGP